MTKEREMLELAAKAAGFKIISVQHGKLNCHDWRCKRNFHWNPLTDDGDAQRLAVKLEMMVDTVNRVVAGYLSDVCIEIDYDEQEKDPYAATRLAIVRAAAEIGRNMT